MTDIIQYPKPGDKDEKGRPVLLRYKFGFDPSKETPVFFMTGFPHALTILKDAGVLNGTERVQLGEVLGVMIKQAIQDRDPLRYTLRQREHNRRTGQRKAGGNDEDADESIDNSLFFCGEEPWIGTPERICHWFRVSRLDWELEEKQSGGPEPLPTHIHGDGSCEMEEDGEGGQFCILISREDEEKLRAEIKKELEAEEDPIHIADCISRLEQFGLIIPVGPDYKPVYPPYPDEDDEDQDALLEAADSKSPLTLRNVDVNVTKTKKKNKDNANVDVRGRLKKNPLSKRTYNLLDGQTIQKLQEGGIDPDHIRFLGSRSGCAEALKESTNPVKAANTMMAREWFSRQFEPWIQKHPAD